MGASRSASALSIDGARDNAIYSDASSEPFSAHHYIPRFISARINRVSVLDYMRVASINHGNDTATSDNPLSPEKRESTGEDSGDIRVQGKSGTLFFHSASSFESRWSIDFNCTELQRGTMAWPCSHRTVAMHKWTNTSPTLSHFRHNFSIKVTQFRRVNEKLTCATKFPLECSTGGSR